MTSLTDLSRRRLRAAVLGLAPLVLSAVAQAQPVVQPLPDPAEMRLNEALRILAQDQRSLTGLLAAGQASLALDNVDAAVDFFRRAEAVSPAHGGVKAGLASVLVRQEKPLEALQLFAQAEAAGEPMAPYAAERGLAYDLIGDNAQAQRDYRLALSLGESPIVSRRLAISQAIAGDQRGSEATLLPMLQRNDLAAYRARAFALAILGKSEEAVSIAETMLPERLSGRMAPYLRYMPRLSRAQKAAAANLGVFPRAADIGRDDPALASYTPVQAARTPQPAVAADTRLAPAGEPLGRREGVIQRTGGGTPLVAAATPPDAPPASVQPATVATSQPIAAPAAALQSPRPEIALATQPSGPIIPSAAPPAAVASPAPVPAVSLSEAFADFSLPSGLPVAAAAEGAVDITKIQPRREAPKVEVATAPAKPAPPPKPVVPSRQWVQVATGRDIKALEFDWRRIKRAAGGLLDKPTPHVAAWGETNRLVAGPFPSAKDAQDLVAKLKEKQIDAFRFISARGEEVEPLD